MAERDQDDPYIGLRQIAMRRIAPVTYWTLWRWARVGARMPDGSVVRLGVVELNRRLYCRRSDVERFMAMAVVPVR